MVKQTDKDYIPQKGDVFVWLKNPTDANSSGHTGIVIEYYTEDNIPRVTIMDASTDKNSVQKRSVKLKYLTNHSSTFYSIRN